MSGILRPLQLDSATPVKPDVTAVIPTTSRRQRSGGQTWSPSFRRLAADHLGQPWLTAQVLAWLHFWPALTIGLAGAVGLGLILTKVPPAQLQNVGLTNSYAPLLLVHWLTISGLVTFLLRHRRRGLLVGLAATWLLFLQLQGVLTFRLAVQSTGLWILVELAGTLFSWLWGRVALRSGGLMLTAKSWSPLPPLPLLRRPRVVNQPHELKAASGVSHQPKHGRKRKRRFFGQ